MDAIVAFQFNAVNRQSWIVPEDCVLVAISTIGAFGAVNGNPSIQLTDYTAPSGLTVDYTCLGICGLSLQQTIQPTPLSKGRKIFVAASGAGSVFLHFQQAS